MLRLRGALGSFFQYPKHAAASCPLVGSIQIAMLMLLRRMSRGDLMAHVNGNKTEAAYQPGDLLAKRRAMMEAWAAHSATLSAAERPGVARLEAAA